MAGRSYPAGELLPWHVQDKSKLRTLGRPAGGRNRLVVGGPLNIVFNPGALADVGGEKGGALNNLSCLHLTDRRLYSGLALHTFSMSR